MPPDLQRTDGLQKVFRTGGRLFEIGPWQQQRELLTATEAKKRMVPEPRTNQPQDNGTGPALR